MRETFVEKTFSQASIETIKLISIVLREYEKQGYDLSLRQLYYQLVARGYIENTQRSYKRIGNLVSDARLAGMIDWNMIEDRGRNTVFSSHWNTPADILRSAAYSFKIDKWENQPYHIEVMVEKQALEGVLVPICQELDIRFTANKGYSSSSTMYHIGKRLEYAYTHKDKQIVILYLGDHDPSGIDMTRDVEERLSMFSQIEAGYGITVERLALNYDQVEEMQPPENPAKETDSRCAAYVRQFGDKSWELDAVEPKRLAELVTDAVYKYRDVDLWDEAVQKEKEYIDQLNKMAADFKG